MKDDSKEKEKFNVLLVDDELEFCELLTIFLQKTKIFSSIITATDVNTANQKIINQHFDLIIVDYQLPKRNGLDFIASLRRMMRLRHTKVILISGHVGQKEVMQAIHTGVKHILIKPFPNKLLIDKIHELLNIPANKDKFKEFIEES